MWEQACLCTCQQDPVLHILAPAVCCYDVVAFQTFVTCTRQAAITYDPCSGHCGCSKQQARRSQRPAVLSSPARAHLRLDILATAGQRLIDDAVQHY